MHIVTMIIALHAADKKSKESFTARQRLFAGIYCLLMVERVDPEDSNVSGRWLSLPEETHCGRWGLVQCSAFLMSCIALAVKSMCAWRRDDHHNAREVFLTKTSDTVPAESVVRTAEVLPFNAYRQAESEGDDIYFCNYEYDELLRRFKLIDNPHSVMPQPIDDSADGEFVADDAADERALAEEDFDSDNDPEVQIVHQRTLSDVGRKRKRQTSALEFFSTTKSNKRASSEKPANKRNRRSSVHSSFPSLTANHSDTVTAGDDEGDQTQTQAHEQQAQAETPLEQAVHRLSLSTEPSHLPCREEEYKAIYNFMLNAVKTSGKSSSRRCMYVSGVPGTGKTATTCRAVAHLRQLASQRRIAPFDYGYINGLKLQTPKHAYSALLEELTGKRSSPDVALNCLEQRFSASAGSNAAHDKRQKRRRSSSGNSSGAATQPSRATIVVVDELDQLVTKDQRVLYNLFEWPSRAGAKLVVVGIANTLDLPERLMPRIASRIGKERARFMPYSAEQLETILRSRLGSNAASAFHSEAIMLAARKVHAVSGDARRCMQLARRAAEMALEDEASSGAECQSGDHPSVATAHVGRAIQESFQSSHLRQLKGASLAERSLLASLCLDVRASGLEESDFGAVHCRLNEARAMENLQPIPVGCLLRSASQLKQRGIILGDSATSLHKQRLALNVPKVDLEHYLADQDQELTWFTSRLRSLARTAGKERS